MSMGRGNLYVSHVLRGRDLLIDMLRSRDHLAVTSKCEPDAKSKGVEENDQLNDHD